MPRIGDVKGRPDGRAAARAGVAALLVASASVLLAGCTPVAGGTGGGTSTPVAVTSAAAVRTIPPKGSCPVRGDLEGRFDQSQMYQYLGCIVPLVDGWIDSVYSDMPHPAAYVFIPVGAQVRTACGTSGDEAFEYCGGDRVVYLGAAQTWDFYTHSGDAAAAFGIAHEVTHHFQHVVGVSAYLDRTYGDRVANPRAHVQEENQADCGGGAFMAYEDREGGLDVQDDVGDIDNVMPELASAESATRDHGTLAERVAAFDVGWTSDAQQPLTVCSRYFPAYPLVR